jgi:ferrous iron transport protein B
LRLSDVKSDESVIITKVLGHGAFRKRITEMGFVKGKLIRVIKNAPFNGAIEYKILNYNVSLRRSEAELIKVVPIEEFEYDEQLFEGVVSLMPRASGNNSGENIIDVVLVGNPNSGKTTLYNTLTGARERTGNYSGVTVDVKKKCFDAFGYTFNIYDLPGTYSLTAYTPEELFVRNFIHDKTPDVVINVVEASNLERNLFLTTQLIDMDLRVVTALNMFDELTKNKQTIDYVNLGRLTGIPMVPTDAVSGTGMQELLQKVIRVFEGEDPISRHIHINYGEEIESSIRTLSHKLKENNTLTDSYSIRYLAIKLLEKDTQVQDLIKEFPGFEEIDFLYGKEIRRIETLFSEHSETVIIDAKYAFIAGALRETLHTDHSGARTASEKIDRILTHPFGAFPVFILVMLAVFYATFKLGSYPMEWIDNGIGLVRRLFQTTLQAGMFKDLLIDGIISGTGSVLVFLPNILILFFFISLLEGSGYMARAAFIMDKIMHRFGLHGRSFIPLIMGFGCNVPAIMATRTLRNRGDRILTMLIVPFMSCSARLPVYILIISAFFSNNQTLILFFIYLLGIFIAFVTANLLNKIAFKNKETPFVMELPAYRLPTFRNIWFQMWDKSTQYLKKIGTVVLLGVILIWALEYFPRNKKTQPASVEIQKENITEIAQPGDELPSKLETESERLANSYLGQIGKLIQPVVSPLGFDWKMSISLLAGLPAKEIIISTLGILYQTSSDTHSANLQNKLQNELHLHPTLSDLKGFSSASALAFLVFVLIYFPCIGVIATIKNESGSWKWAVFSVVYTTGLAWILAFITFQTVNLIS